MSGVIEGVMVSMSLLGCKCAKMDGWIDEPAMCSSKHAFALVQAALVVYKIMFLITCLGI